MKIDGIACYGIEIPAKDGGYTMSRGRVLKSFPSTVVKVTAQDGTVGYGEACTLGANYLDGFPGSVRATVGELADFLLDCDPLQPAALVDGMDALVIGHLPAKAAIDIAMWDLRGKLLGQPVAQLLGGVRQHSFAAFQAISLDEPENMVAELRRMGDVGFRRWQLKLGDDPQRDAERVRAVAAALPPGSQFLTSDPNRGYTVAGALRFVQGVSGIDTYVEQPCPTLADLQQVRQHTAQPLMIDEAARTPAELIDALGCVNAINLKPVRVGGLTKAAIMRDIAQAAGLEILVDDPQGADLATAGLAQLAATIDPRHYLGVSYFMGAHMPLSYRPPGSDSGPEFDAGIVRWRDAPGLGVDIDERVLGDPILQISRR
jgi:L-alanine-DL-glutamate epimerase-like enolase superfamily enzyme